MDNNIIYGAFGAATKQGKLRERQIARLREIENASARRGMGKKGHIFTGKDRIRAARAVGQLVHSARRQGILVSEIRNALNGTSRIDRYMLPAEIDDATADARSWKLQGKVSGYLAVAEAIARLIRGDADALKISVLAETSLWSQPASSHPDDDPRASHLAMELTEMGRSVAQQTKLQALLKRASRIPGRWDVTSEIIAAASRPSLPGEAYLEGNEHWTEAPPLPSIPLVRCIHAVFLSRLRVEREGRAEPLDLATDHEADFDADEEAGLIELSREIRLALGPTTSTNEIGLMFETRAHVRLGLLGEGISFMEAEVRPNCTLKPKDDVWAHVPIAVFQTHREGVWRRIATVDRIDEVEGRLFVHNGDPIYWPINPLDPKSPSLEHWYFSWIPVNEATLDHWLDRPSGTNDTIAIRHEGTGSGDPVWYAHGTIAHEIERDLATGGLKLALEQAVDRVRHALSERECKWRDEAQSVHEQRMAQWQKNVSEDGQDDAGKL